VGIDGSAPAVRSRQRRELLADGRYVERALHEILLLRSKVCPASEFTPGAEP
jgi:hypothetical protein